MRFLCNKAFIRNRGGAHPITCDPFKSHVFIIENTIMVGFCCKGALEQLAIWSMSMGILAELSSEDISRLTESPLNALIVFSTPFRVCMLSRTLNYVTLSEFEQDT